MITQTLVVKVPDGYELKYNIVKVKSDTKRGRPLSNLKNDPEARTWNVRNRELVSLYNKEYYQRKKAERLQQKENHVLANVKN